MAERLGEKAAGVMISVNQLRKRRSSFVVGDWILDSGAFTEISRFGHYRYPVEEYAQQIERWKRCGNLLRAVAQDWMCEGFILKRTGLTVSDHQRLTIERYDELCALVTDVEIMPVLQGYRVHEYMRHIDQYGTRLSPGMWVGVGSLCKRNGNPEMIEEILASIKNKRPDLRLHGFGIKQTAIESKAVREHLYSADSMAYSYSRRFGDTRSEEELADIYLEKIQTAVNDSVQKRVPSTAGAGNGQGRKSKWRNGPTVPIRVPLQFAEALLEMAREWDDTEGNVLPSSGEPPLGHDF
jgi:hypothetical protein